MRTRGWIAALLLVVAVNAVVLAGVAWNRAGQSESTLRLTERELPLVTPYADEPENTGMALRLKLNDESYSPAWLDAEKLRQLGFSVPDVVVQHDEYTKKSLPRFAWAVLEFDGPAWQAFLAQEEAQIDRSRLEADEGNALTQTTQRLQEALARTRENGSRLVAVDVGQDAAALRARYADNTRYLITGAEVGVGVGRAPSPDDDDEAPMRVEGYLRVLIDRLHVQPRHRALMQSIVGDDRAEDRQWGSAWPPRYEVVLTYGRGHEPWVVDIAAFGDT
jgi:hypothetical protein